MTKSSPEICSSVLALLQPPWQAGSPWHRHSSFQSLGMQALVELGVISLWTSLEMAPTQGLGAVHALTFSRGRATDFLSSRAS